MTKQEPTPAGGQLPVPTPERQPDAETEHEPLVLEWTAGGEHANVRARVVVGDLESLARSVRAARGDRPG